ncbi:MAG TPA: hypothetical protein VF941_15935, partial [Clostridia bacterium]
VGIAKKVESTVSNIKGSISNAASSVKNKIGDFFSGFKSTVIKIGDKVKDAWNSFANECSKLFKKAMDIFADFGRKVGEVAEYVAKKAKAVADYVVEHKDEILDGLKKVGIAVLDVFQFALDILGLIPAVGEIADALNGCIYLLRGDYLNAGLSFAACIPFAGWAATGGKLVNKFVKVIEKIGSIGKLIDKVKDFAKYFEKIKDIAKVVSKYSDNVIGFIKKRGNEVWSFLSRFKLVEKAKGIIGKVIEKGVKFNEFLEKEVNKAEKGISEWCGKQVSVGIVPKHVAELINKKELEKEIIEKIAKEGIEKVEKEKLEKIETEVIEKVERKVIEKMEKEGIEKVEKEEVEEIEKEVIDEIEKEEIEKNATEVSKTTEGSVKKINEINQLMQDAANKKTLEILESQSKTAAGPCLSEIYDPLTGKIAYGQNFKTSATGKIQYYQWLENDADPIIKNLVSNYEAKIKSGEIILSEVADFRLAAHSEIVALDEVLKNRRALGLPVDETTLSELYLQNIDLSKAYKTGEIVPKIRCEHCRYLTDGINILNHN